jgi:hypothetical protein
MSPTIGATCPLCLVACHLWKLLYLVHVVVGVFETHLYSPLHLVRHPVQEWTLWKFGTSGFDGLGCSVMVMVKGPKVGAMWIF